MRAACPTPSWLAPKFRNQFAGPARHGTGSFVATHWMPASLPAGASTVWQASACLDAGSWNQAVLVEVPDDTPIGNQLGLALICDSAFGVSTSAPASAMPDAMAAQRREVIRIVWSPDAPDGFVPVAPRSDRAARAAPASRL